MGSGAREFRWLFPQSDIPIILRSIFQAGKSLQKKTVHDREDWITRRLHRRLIRKSPFRDGPLDIRLQPEIVDPDCDEGAATGQIDLLVSCGLGHETYFAIEAKRLRLRSPHGRLSAGNDQYVKEGMMRFVSGQYAPLMESGAMLGYVYDGKIDKARSGIGRYIETKVKELKLKPPQRLTRSRILPGEPVDETQHGLKTRTFIIYHLFITV